MKATALLLVFALASQVAAQDHAAMLEDQPAPFSGVLVREARFAEYLQLQLRMEELEGRLEIQKNLVMEIEQIYSEKLETATRPARWYESPGTNQVFGFLLGVTVAVAVFFGGAELAKAMR